MEESVALKFKLGSLSGWSHYKLRQKTEEVKMLVGFRFGFVEAECP